MNSQLAEEMVAWQLQDAQLLSIKSKLKEPHKENTSIHNRYYILENNSELYFTHREMELLLFLEQPLTYKDIGEELDLSDRTIECHVRRMRIKINCVDRFELIKKVMALPAVQAFKATYYDDERVD